jgi:precorrin-2/cobalt-factor-2 C20-methyltransferase
MSTFYGVGVGPGDPELLTLKAARIIKESPVLAVPGKTKETSTAYRIASKAIPDLDKKECICIFMPMTKDEDKLAESHEKGCAQIVEQLKKGKSVAFLVLGDPGIYSTYLYLQRRVEQAGYHTMIVSGIASFLAASAALGQGLVEQDEQLHIIPSSYDIGDALDLPGTKVFMKAGKHMPALKQAVLNRQAEIYLVENCGMEGERICTGAENIPDGAGYYSIVIVKEKICPLT